MRETILAIDPSINYPGYAVVDNGRLIHYCVSKTWTGTKKGSDRERMSAIRQAVEDMCVQYRPTVVVIEDYQFRASDVRLRNKDHIKKMIWSIGVAVMAVPNHIPIVFYKPQEWKGRKNKDDIIFEAKTVYGINGKLNNNAADAIMLAHHHHTGKVIENVLQRGCTSGPRRSAKQSVAGKVRKRTKRSGSVSRRGRSGKKAKR